MAKYLLGFSFLFFSLQLCDEAAPCHRKRPQAVKSPYSGFRANGMTVVLPDHGIWKKVTVGMTTDQVLDLLGSPLERTDRHPWYLKRLKRLSPEQRLNYTHHWTYGKIEFSMPSLEYAYRLRLAIRQDTVTSISDPFAGQWGNDGRPSAPRLILPKDGAALDHFPRVVDYRWDPSPSVHPVKYMLEVQVGNYTLVDGKRSIEYRARQQFDTTIPHRSAVFSGKNPGRWRVRASNRHGQSEWTDFRYFEFSQ